MTTSSDRIEKKVVLNAPRERVPARDHAVSIRQFGSWFAASSSTGLSWLRRAGVTGKITPTTADAEVAKMQIAVSRGCRFR